MVSQRRQEQVGTYLSELGPKLQEMDGLFSVVVLDGRLLADLLRKPPTDSSDPGVCVCVCILCVTMNAIMYSHDV